jgi:hypothetical protein
MNHFVIIIRGEAGPTVRAAFEDFDITVADGTTVLRGQLIDRAALYGLLQRLQDFGIEILEVRTDGPGNEHIAASPKSER